LLRRTLYLPLAAIVWIGAAGCTDGESKPVLETLDHHVSLNLDEAWSGTPWKAEIDETGRPLKGPDEATISTHFVLPDAWVGHGSILELEGLRWSAEVEVNGHDLPSITGGPGPSNVPIGTFLKPGKNTIEVTLNGRGDTQPLLVGDNTKDARLSAPPSITLQPLVGLENAVASIGKGGVQLSAQTRGAPDGSVVEFEAWLDGVRIQEWSAATVENGVANVAGQPWNGPLWSLSNPSSSLFLLNVRLVDHAGKQLDQGVWRTGLRQFSLGEHEFRLNGKALHLLGSRHRSGGFLAGLSLLESAGLNLIEFHGEMPSRAVLRDADELGVAIAVLPRCDGRIQATLEQATALKSELSKQDARMIAQASNAPSVLLWSTEGTALNRKGYSVGRPLIESMTADPVDRLVAAWDLPAFAIPGTGPDEQTLGQRERAGHEAGSAFWVLEFHLGGAGQISTVDTVAAALRSSIALGAVGGVLPGEKEGDTTWAQTWAKHTGEMGVESLSLDGNRAHSRASIKGLTGGQIASLHFEGGGHYAWVTGPSSETTVEAWHHGPATFSLGGAPVGAVLSQGQWQGLQWTGLVMDLAAKPAPAARTYSLAGHTTDTSR
jgi:hypothetical protein